MKALLTFSGEIRRWKRLISLRPRRADHMAASKTPKRSVTRPWTPNRVRSGVPPRCDFLRGARWCVDGQFRCTQLHHQGSCIVCEFCPRGWIVELSEILKPLWSFVSRNSCERCDYRYRIVAHDACVDGALHPAGPVDHREAGFAGSVVQQHRCGRNDDQNQRHHQDADPEAAGAHVLEVFPRCYEQRFGRLNGHSCLPPRGRRSRAATPRACRICGSSAGSPGLRG